LERGLPIGLDAHTFFNAALQTVVMAILLGTVED
jgi:hypothetical protein